MKSHKKILSHIADKVRRNQRLKPTEIDQLLSFKLKEKESSFANTAKQVAFPLALLFGFLFVTFAEFFDELIATLPTWTNMSPGLAAGVDYLWDFLGEPIGKENIIYHVPNIVLYTFGFFGIKKIIESVEKKTWLESVLTAQVTVQDLINTGSIAFEMKRNHSILFVGKGDFVAEQFIMNNNPDEAVIVAETKPSYTDIWNCYDLCTLYDDLKRTLHLADASSAGEYLFFPIQDSHLFLPNDHAFDLAPHKLEILVQNIRTIEKEEGWAKNRVIIVGDAKHHSFVQTEDEKKAIPHSEEIISLASIAKNHEDTYLIDPTEIVLKKIISIAHGRKIVFRATREGMQEYKERFYERLTALKYITKKSMDVLTIGYDVFEDLTEQQTLKKNKNYVPVILSKQVKDAVERNGYKKSEYIYVPDLVLEEMRRLTTNE